MFSVKSYLLYFGPNFFVSSALLRAKNKITLQLLDDDKGWLLLIK